MEQRSGRRVVGFSDAEVVPGGEIGLPDKHIGLYLLPTTDGRAVVQVIPTGIAGSTDSALAQIFATLEL